MRSPDEFPSVLLVDADPALAELLADWLAGAGYHVRPPPGDAGGAGAPVDLIVADVSFPRSDAAAQWALHAARHPQAPVLALSACFFPGVAMQGSVAQGLGVAAVLAKPVSRDTLIGAVAQLLRGPRP